MARWLPCDRDKTVLPNVEQFEAPNYRDALDKATMLYGERVHHVVSVVSHQLTQERIEAQRRQKYRDSENYD